MTTTNGTFLLWRNVNAELVWRGSAVSARLLLGVGVFAIAGGCGRHGETGSVAPAQAPVPVVVEAVNRCDIPAVLEVVGRTDAVATVEIRANVEGTLTGMSFREGRMVTQGQVLLQIDPRRYEAAVQLAKAGVEKAAGDLELARGQNRLAGAEANLLKTEADLLKTTQDVERLNPLAERRAVPRRDLETAVAAQSSAQAAVADARVAVQNTKVGERVAVSQAEALLNGAKASLATAELDLAEATIRAPIAGLIGRLGVSVGNYVGRGGQVGPLATISQLDPINVTFSIPEALYLRVTAEGADRDRLKEIELVLADDTVYPHRGQFTMIERMVDSRTGSLVVQAQFPNPQGVLLPGMFGRIRATAQVRHDVILVPERGLFDAQGSKAVYVVSPENTVALRSVIVDGSYQTKSIITGGLAGGEKVIVEGILKLRPGQPVTIAAPSATPTPAPALTTPAGGG